MSTAEKLTRDHVSVADWAAGRVRMASSPSRRRRQTLSVAMIGTRGVPARYGGFETAVEEIGVRLAERGHHVTVYCRNPGQTLREYRGMHLVNLPAIRLRAAETLSHTVFSMLHQQLRPHDAAIVFNAANSPFLPLLRARGIPVAINVDGLERARQKWGPVGRRWHVLGEQMASRWADVLIADAEAIAVHYRAVHDVDPCVIAYGHNRGASTGTNRLAEVGCEPGKYHLVVARLEPENSIAMIADGLRMSRGELPLVVVGGAPYRSDLATLLADRAAEDPRLRPLGSVWDSELLDQLYANARLYIHGHSVGGTNPSLLRAMGVAAPVAALDAVYNREVLADAGDFFGSSADLAALMEDAEAAPERWRSLGRRGQLRVRQHYDWDDVALQYEAMLERMAARQMPAVIDLRSAMSAGTDVLAGAGSWPEGLQHHSGTVAPWPASTTQA